MYRVMAILLLFALTTANAQIPQPADQPVADHEPGETESVFRRGEVIFFISYPFTFLGSFATYMLAGYAVSAADGKNNFSPGGGFYALTAMTAAIFSFGIAMQDYYAVKAKATAYEGKPGAAIAFERRF